MYPNLYVLLVAPPAVGKSQAISPVKELWNKTKKFHIAPDDVSKASLIDALEAAKQFKVLDSANMVEYTTLQIAASEFGVLVPAHDLGFLNTLNHIFDNPDTYKEKKRTTKKETNIVEPQINLLAGTQPAYMAELLPETAWGMGFTSRLILVYSQNPIKVNLFKKRERHAGLQSKLVEDLASMSELYGEVQWTPEAMEAVTEWYDGGMQPVPKHAKLEHYNGRRILHMLKLCTISAVSRGAHMVIQLADVQRAKEWMLEVEQFMPDIFKAMVGRSDVDILEDLHALVWQTHSVTQKSVHKQRLFQYLQTKVPAERVPRIIELAFNSGLIKPASPEDGVNSQLWNPGAKPNRLLE